MTASPPLPRAGLWDLDRVALPEDQERWLAGTAAHLQGPPPWKRRKLAEARDLFALAAIAPRLQVLAIDPTTTLMALLELRMPVPCRAAGTQEVTVARRARLVLRYPEEALRRPLPGTAFVAIESPEEVFHPNVGGRHLCLGASVAPGTPARELVLAAFQALTLAAHHVDPGSGAGVMNPEAAAWWAANLSRVPLTRAPFLADPAADVEEAP